TGLLAGAPLRWNRGGGPHAPEVAGLPDSFRARNLPAFARGERPDADAWTEREHGRGAGLARRRSVPAAPERAVARGLHAQSAASARGSQRLPHRGPPADGRAAQRRDAHGRRMARAVQVLQWWADLAEHADPRISAGLERQRAGLAPERI